MKKILTVLTTIAIVFGLTGIIKASAEATRPSKMTKDEKILKNKQETRKEEVEKAKKAQENSGEETEEETSQEAQ